MRSVVFILLRHAKAYLLRNKLITASIVIFIFSVGFASVLLISNEESAQKSAVRTEATVPGALHSAEEQSAAAQAQNVPEQFTFPSMTNSAITGSIVQVEGGNYNTCLRTSNGDVYCWGQGAYGQLGTNTHFKGTPTKALVSDAREVVSGGRFGCIRDSKGEVYCWGETQAGQTGNPKTEECGDMTIDSVCQPVPQKVNALKDVVQLSAGNDFACALLRNNSVQCWGDNSLNQLGNSGQSSMAPVTVPEIQGATMISSGDAHTCALIGRPGQVFCWGDNESNQSGDSSGVNQIPGINDAIAVSAGGAHTCIIHATKKVSCWGYNYLGQLGSGSTRPTRTSSPQAVLNLSNVEQVVSGRYHNCARLTDGSVYCWGLNRKGEIGDGTTENRNLPTKVEGLEPAMYLSAGKWHYCAITSSNQVKCWGDNLGGQLGTGNVNSDANPHPISVSGLP